MTSLRIGVLGGSFDPIHYGHLVAASQVAEQLGLDRVVLCPTGESWHKATPDAAPAEMRCRLTAAAVADDPRLALSRVDVQRPGPTYTVDTLRDLRAEHDILDPGAAAEWFFIMGADALADVPGWRDPAGILAQAHLVGVTRPGHVLDDPGLPAGSFTLVEIPALDISSSDLRRRVREGRTIDYLCPPAVVALIDELGLYRA